jgi:hypothetical protein
MLQSTATAHSEVRTSRHDSCRGRLEHFQQLGFVMLPVMAGTPEPDAFARQGAGDESCLSLPDYSLSGMRESRNCCDFFGVAYDPP